MTRSRMTGGGVTGSRRVLASELGRHVGEQVSVAGWLHRKRQLKAVTFLIVRDRSGLVQVVLTPEQNAVQAVADLTEETVIEVTGLVTASPQAPGGAEISKPALTTLSERAEPPPFDLYRPAVTAGLATVLDHAPTTLRHPLLRAGLEISAASVAGFRAALDA
jgi:nondiscriminating aspartyl-tRNA synthetase